MLKQSGDAGVGLSEVAGKNLSAEELKATARERTRLREIEAINRAIDSGTYATKRDRVACLLNMYPECRDSDMTLTLKYWEIFQEDLYQNKQLTPYLLFKLERLTTIARLRAKIQNDYGLFLGSEEVRNKRRQREEDVRTDILNDSAPPRMIQIFADETGKNEEYVIVGSVWFLNLAKGAHFQTQYQAFKERIGFKGEFHFSEIKKGNQDAYRAFVDFAQEHRDYVSFKAIATRRKGNSRPVEEVITKLCFLLMVKGFQHELETGRVTIPRRVRFVVDKSGGPDSIGKEDLERSVSRELKDKYGDASFLESVTEIDSKHSGAIQLADLISGALNRKMNHEEAGGLKEDLADYVIRILGLKLDESIVSDDAFRLIQF